MINKLFRSWILDKKQKRNYKRDDMTDNENQDGQDLTQDEKIEANFRLIQQQTALLREFKHYFLPDAEEKRQKAFIKKIARLSIKIVISIAFIFGFWDLAQWYHEQKKIQAMANRYATIAEKLYYIEGNPEVALEFLNRAIEMQENNPEFRFQRAYMDGMVVVRHLLNLDRPLNKKDLDAAHQSLAQALFLKSLETGRVEPYILEGQVYVVLKEFERAKEQIEMAIELSPDNDFAYVRLATLLLEMDQIDKADQAITKALEINPKSKWAWLWRGVILSENRNEYSAAREAFQKALDIDPRFDLAWYNLGWTWVNQHEKEYSVAQEIMQKVLSLNPDYKEAYYAIGMFYGYQRNYHLAHVYMDNALNVDNNFLTALKWRGVIRREMGNYEEAIKDFNSAIQLNPMNARLYIRRAGAFEDLNRLDEAMSDLRFASELEPDNRRIWYTMGSVFIKANNPSRAQLSYQKALNIDSSYSDAYAGISEAYFLLGDTQEAINTINKAIANTNYRPERYILAKGRLLERIGRFEDAIVEFKNARELDDTFFDAWWAEAQLSTALLMTKDAFYAVARCLELRPEHEGARNLQLSLDKEF